MTHPSHNHGERRGAALPSLIVIHYTGMDDAASARDRLCDPAAEVSAHWLIHDDGTPEALVPEDRRAWHAGAGSWRGQDDVNSRSIGIEIANPGNRPFAAAQMDTLELLLALIFTIVIVVIAVAGSVWVMYHLNVNMMPTHEMQSMG